MVRFRASDRTDEADFTMAEGDFRITLSGPWNSEIVRHLDISGVGYQFFSPDIRLGTQFMLDSDGCLPAESYHCR